MKHSFLLLLIIFPSVLFSQNHQGEYQMYRYEENTNYKQLPQYELYKKDFIMKNKIHSVTETFTLNDTTFIRKVVFNENGLVERIKEKDGIVSYEYVNDSLLKKITVEGKDKKEIKYTYRKGKVIAKEIFKNGELTSVFLTQYNDDDRVSFTSLQNGKKLKKNYLLRYYYEGDDLRSQSFYAKGKLTRKWDYSCSEEGKEVEKAFTSQFCEYSEESNDGSYIKYERRQYGERVFLYKRYYTKDSVLYKYEDVNEDGTIYSKGTYSKDSVVELSFDYKGRIRKSQTWYLNKDGKTKKSIKKHFKRNKLDQVWTYYYNDQNRRTKVVRVDGRKQYVYIKGYNEAGLITEIKNSNKKKTIMHHSYEYEYY